MNIFVANLNFRIQSSYLKELFENFGEVVSAKVIMDRETGKSKGYGFVEMANEEEGNTAISQLNDAEIEGKNISVRIATPQTKSENSFNNGGGYQKRNNNFRSNNNNSRSNSGSFKRKEY